MVTVGPHHLFGPLLGLANRPVPITWPPSRPRPMGRRAAHLRPAATQSGVSGSRPTAGSATGPGRLAAVTVTSATMSVALRKPGRLIEPCQRSTGVLVQSLSRSPCTDTLPTVQRCGSMSGLPMVCQREMGATMQVALPITSAVGMGRPQVGGAAAGLSYRQL